MTFTVKFLIVVGGFAKEDISVVFRGRLQKGEKVMTCCNAPFRKVNRCKIAKNNFALNTQFVLPAAYHIDI